MYANTKSAIVDEKVDILKTFIGFPEAIQNAFAAGVLFGQLKTSMDSPEKKKETKTRLSRSSQRS